MVRRPAQLAACAAPAAFRNTRHGASRILWKFLTLNPKPCDTMCAAFLRGTAPGLVRGMGAAAAEAACSPVLCAGAAQHRRALIRPPSAQATPSRRGSGRTRWAMAMECTEDNVLRALQAAREQWPDMLGQTDRARKIGITGNVELASLDGPFVTLRLTGRFWHRRTTVMSCVAGPKPT